MQSAPPDFGDSLWNAELALIHADGMDWYRKVLAKSMPGVDRVKMDLRLWWIQYDSLTRSTH